MLSEHFYTSPYGLTEVLTSTLMMIIELYTNSQDIFLRGISFQRPRAFRTATASCCAPVCAPVYAPDLLTDRSQPIRSSACSADPADVEFVSQQTLDNILTHPLKNKST